MNITDPSKVYSTNLVKKKMTSEQLAKKIRLDAWDMAYKGKASHMGGNFSVADVIAVLYSDVANVFPDNPDEPNRDRVVLSKGHCCAVLYATLAEMGFFDKSVLDSFGQDGSILSCHISHRVPGVEISSGSLGHGVCMATGMALNAKVKSKKYRVYAICGDGECNEGSVWETIMFAAQQALDNMTIIVDANGMQAMGNTRDIINLDSLKKKFEDFGWFAIDVDGHNHDELRKAFDSDSQGKPKAIVAHTIKGKGVSFMENDLWWHYQVPFGEYYDRAVVEMVGE